MHPVLARTVGGLSGAYLFRQFVFGAAFAGLVYAMASHGHNPMSLAVGSMFVVNTLLYPYARFVYESVVNFVIGENVFIGPALLVLAAKFVTIALCWFLAMFIAPIGWAYLYWHHSRRVQ